MSDPTSTDWPIFQGRTCLPPSEDPLGLSGNCTLGGFAAYSVAVTTVAQIQTSLAFVQKYNIRLNVRNTGHDFADKGLGAGALSIWTHKLNNLQFIKNYGPANGAAFKLASGVLTEDVYKAADANRCCCRRRRVPHLSVLLVATLLVVAIRPCRAPSVSLPTRSSPSRSCFPTASS